MSWHNLNFERLTSYILLPFQTIRRFNHLRFLHIEEYYTSTGPKRSSKLIFLKLSKTYQWQSTCSVYNNRKA